jgi:hypothetical protein
MPLDYDGKLMIFTSFYKQQAFAGYVQSLAVTIGVLERLGIKYDYCPRAGDFHIERAVNDSLTRFAEDDSFTDWINIDADHSWDAKSLVEIMVNTEPVVCASYRMTNKFDKYTGSFVKSEDGQLMGKITGADTALLLASRIPAGFMRLKKEVVTKYIEENPEDYFWLGEDHPRKVFRFIWNEMEGHTFIGMDIALAKKMADMGYALYVDPNLKVSHWGMVEFGGTLDETLRQEVKINEAKAKLLEAKEAMAHAAPGEEDASQRV